MCGLHDDKKIGVANSRDKSPFIPFCKPKLRRLDVENKLEHRIIKVKIAYIQVARQIFKSKDIITTILEMFCAIGIG
jgi:hypothetical protein